MVKLKVVYNSGKEFTLDCYRFDDGQKEAGRLILYSDKNTVPTSLYKQKIKSFEVVK